MWSPVASAGVSSRPRPAMGYWPCHGRRTSMAGMHPSNILLHIIFLQVCSDLPVTSPVFWSPAFLVCALCHGSHVSWSPAVNLCPADVNCDSSHSKTILGVRPVRVCNLSFSCQWTGVPCNFSTRPSPFNYCDIF